MLQLMNYLNTQTVLSLRKRQIMSFMNETGSCKPFFWSVTIHIDGLFLWPPRSPDLTFTDLYVWGHPYGMFTLKKSEHEG